jgi:hypothetical protein
VLFTLFCCFNGEVGWETNAAVFALKMRGKGNGRGTVEDALFGTCDAKMCAS